MATKSNTTEWIKNVNIKVPISPKEYTLLDFEVDHEKIPVIKKTENGVCIVFSNGKQSRFEFMETIIKYFTHSELQEIRK